MLRPVKYSMRVLLATTLLVLFVSASLPVFADSLKIESIDGTVTLDAHEIEIAPDLLRATGGAHIVMPPTKGLSVPGPASSGTQQTAVFKPTPQPVIIDAPTVEIRYPAYKASEGVRLTQGDVTMTAREISGNLETSVVQSSGGVVFTQEPRKFFADRFEYNYATRTGQMLNAGYIEEPLIVRGREIRAEDGTLRLLDATATTCDLPAPHYRITAKEITLTRDRRLIAKGVTVWLGKTRVFAFPRMVFSVAGGEGRRSIFPRPGYDSKDGFYLAVGFPLYTSDRLFTNLWLRWTTRNSFQGKASAEYLLAGDPAGLLRPLVTGSEVELRERPPLVPVKREVGTEIKPGETAGRQLRAFIEASRKERIFKPNDDSVLLDREPEIGLKYALPGLQVTEDTDIPELRSEGRISWGRFKEDTNPNVIDRFDVRAFAAPTIIRLKSDWYLLPVALGRWSHYSTNQEYTTLGVGLDVTKVIAPGTFGTIRYINHMVGGDTPFVFDKITVDQEIQSILQYRGKKNFAALTLYYDVDNSDLYDWELTYGRTLHCLEPRITWRREFSRLSFSLKVIGF